jgi:hypothetical protein
MHRHAAIAKSWNELRHVAVRVLADFARVA